MKKIIGYALTYVPLMIVGFAGFVIGEGRQTLTFTQTTYLTIMALMLGGIYWMGTSRDERSKNKITWLRMVDVILLFSFIVAVLNDFLNRHNQNVTMTNSALILLCGFSMYFHERVRDHRIAKLLEIYKAADEKRGLDESTVIK